MSKSQFKKKWGRGANTAYMSVDIPSQRLEEFCTDVQECNENSLDAQEKERCT